MDLFLCSGRCEKEENYLFYFECEFFGSIWHNILKWLELLCFSN